MESPSSASFSETHSLTNAAPALDTESAPFVGQWNQLVSTSNWEKGRIIQQWREALIESGAPPAESSDEAWARRVGGVTGQHVGRLRRVFQRFGENHTSYDGLYWSHFQAALDWDDAEMWLEGGLQNGWSVSQMRRQRWEVTGGEEPRDEEIVASELDEDFEPALNQQPQALSGDPSGIASGPLHEGPDFGDESDVDSGLEPYLDPNADQLPADAADRVRPFADLPNLPEDVADAFDTFKLAILHHKAANWADISEADVLAALDSLKTLVMAPSSQEAPF
ncbi:hypothetical protein [Lignipirellula cremea]|uniref:Uncharacterized protein n=1 Tax=Lignipirellula cremea TaxID=2528010 RepID=A0A518E301_9BACT|nr:hypothetical protein [Lignipirellula cremea]QDU98458.1 hypothetical protein Pla8534_63260 [Lignipirellula cremea]